MPSTSSRRDLLRALAGAGAAALAGCGSDRGSRSTDTHRSPTRTDPPRTDGAPPTDRRTTGSPTRTGRTTDGPAPGPRTPESDAVDWRFATLANTVAPPAATGDAVYAGTAAASMDRQESARSHVFALDRSEGAERWRFDLGRVNVVAGPAVVDSTVASGETVLAVTGVEGSMFARDFAVQALSTRGEHRWRVGLSGPGEVLGLAGGRLYLTTHDGQYGTDSYPQTALTAVDVAAGETRWHETFGHLRNVTLGDDLLATHVAEDDALVAVGADGGSEQFRADGLRPIAAADGAVYAVDRADEAVLKLSGDGTEQWRTTASQVVDGRVVGDTLYALREVGVTAIATGDGEALWTETVAENPEEWPATATDGERLYLARGNTVGALSRADGRVWTRRTLFGTLRQVGVTGDWVVAGAPGMGVGGVTAAHGTRRWSVIDDVAGFDATGGFVAATTGDGDVLGIAP